MGKRILISMAVCVAAVSVWAQDSPFVGQWKLNPAKSKLTDVMKVESLGGNRYSFDLGGPNPEQIAVDGTDQPGILGTTLAVSAEGPNHWTVVRKKDGKVQVTGIWTLAADGNTLHDDFTYTGPKGDTVHMVYVYQRKGGGPGFAGKWVSTTEQVDTVYEIKVQPYEGDGLSFISPSESVTRNVKFDGNDYPNAGPGTAGSATSARRLDGGAVELTDKLNGKVTDTQKVEVSADGKTMTMTVHLTTRDEPDVLVFERQ